MPRNFNTQYDVGHGQAPDIRFAGGVAEAGPQVDAREPFADLLLSDGFKEVMRLVILPRVKELRGALLRKVTMSEVERARYVGSLYILEDTIAQIFKRAGEEMPAWLSAQFK